MFILALIYVAAFEGLFCVVLSRYITARCVVSCGWSGRNRHSCRVSCNRTSDVAKFDFMNICH